MLSIQIHFTLLPGSGTTLDWDTLIHTLTVFLVSTIRHIATTTSVSHGASVERVPDIVRFRLSCLLMWLMCYCFHVTMLQHHTDNWSDSHLRLTLTTVTTQPVTLSNREQKCDAHLIELVLTLGIAWNHLLCLVNNSIHMKHTAKVLLMIPIVL